MVETDLGQTTKVDKAMSILRTMPLVEVREIAKNVDAQISEKTHKTYVEYLVEEARKSPVGRVVSSGGVQSGNDLRNRSR